MTEAYVGAGAGKGGAGGGGGVGGGDGNDVGGDVGGDGAGGGVGSPGGGMPHHGSVLSGLHLPFGNQVHGNATPGCVDEGT